MTSWGVFGPRNNPLENRKSQGILGSRWLVPTGRFAFQETVCAFGGVPSNATLYRRERGPMEDLDSEWQRKGATLSDKTARREYGLKQDEIVQAIRAGKLHYRLNSVYGNPFLRLIRREVEMLLKKGHGIDFLKEQQARTELARIARELKRLKAQIAALEERKSKLIADSGR